MRCQHFLDNGNRCSRGTSKDGDKNNNYCFQHQPENKITEKQSTKKNDTKSSKKQTTSKQSIINSKSNTRTKPKIIASGTSGVIFKPILLCKQDIIMNEKYKDNPNIIMKVDKDNTPDQLELRMCKKVHIIDPEEKYTLPLNGDTCVVDYNGPNGDDKIVNEERIGYFCGFGGPTLTKMLENAHKKPIEFKNLWKWYSHLIKGLYLLDRNGLHHGDLRADNIVIKTMSQYPEGIPKMIDFGFAFDDFPDDNISSGPWEYGPIWLNAVVFAEKMTQKTKKEQNEFLKTMYNSSSRLYDNFGLVKNSTNDPFRVYSQAVVDPDARRDFVNLQKGKIDTYMLTHIMVDNNILFWDPREDKRFKKADDIDIALFEFAHPIFTKIMNPWVEETWTLQQLVAYIDMVNNDIRNRFKFDPNYHI